MGGESKCGPQAYVSGPLIVLAPERREEFKRFYEHLAAVCEEEGYIAYLPHRNSDPVEHTDLSPQEVVALDNNRILESKLVVAYVGIPSPGVGGELVFASMQNPIIPAVILAEEEELRNRRISRYVRGQRSVVKEIAFTTYDDACTQLRNFLRYEFHRIR